MNELTDKSLGQHWLNDESSLNSIVAAADLNPKDAVLEIGPGPGSLTEKLIKSAQTVVAVEVDSTLADKLHRTINSPNLQIIKQDILKFDFSQLPVGYKVVANIPYYLTSHLFRLLYSQPNPPKKAVVLVQKEVAQRAAAKPGQMSTLAVSLQLKNETKLGAVVPANLFVPPPKVDSQVLVLNFRSKPLFGDSFDEKLYMQIVKAGFSARRKKLRSSLSGGLGISKSQAEKLLEKAGVSGDLRAQNLSLQHWYKIYLVCLEK